MADAAGGSAGRVGARWLGALVVGQLGLHSAMAGLRMAAPLQALREGYSAWSVGLLLALFAAAPVLIALHSGRMADRHGYHRPVYLACGLAGLGMAAAVASTFLEGPSHFALLCLAAAGTGSAANVGMLVLQRTAGLEARDNTERLRIFSWLGVAPSLSNVIGPVMVGLLIDLGGFRWAYVFLLLLPLLTVAAARWVPRRPSPAAPLGGAERSAWDLLGAPGMKRLLFVNWLLSSCWDVHSFAVPILGHERGFSATTIGLILGAFTASVTVVRLALPLVAHRLSEVVVIRAAMVGTGAVFALYPLATTPWLMVACALLLGVTLGVVQPMILSTLHHLTPDGRHGEALAFRSMALNGASTVMPLLFGLAGSVLSAGALFWLMGSAVGAGSWVVGRLEGIRT